MTGAHFAAVVVFATLAVAVLVLGVVVIIEHIIIKKRIEELNRAHGGMKVATSWLSRHARWDASGACPVIKPERVAVVLPEIVRCRDCKYLIAHGAGCAHWDNCDIESIDGFCAWGERRGDAE